jgi:hypothetical protein
MKLQLLSDLHLEVQADWQAQPAPDADLLVLAGDIGSYQAGTRLADINFGLTRFSPLHGWPTPVVFVPGNHEYDGLDFDEAHDLLKTVCQRLGIIWLERETLVWPNPGLRGQAIRLVGTTLWTDFDALAVQATGHTDLAAAQLKAREKAFRAANYYLRTMGTTRQGEPLLAPAVREQGLRCQAWLQQVLHQPFDGDTVVITHFAPSLHSADPRYGLTPGTAGFCNALDDWLALASHWLHGHLHTALRYHHRGCEVIANPLGYARKHEQVNFSPLMCVNI